MSCVAIIPAKGTSTRLPGKNIRMFHGKPIIQYSIEAAKHTRLFDRIIVSTDSPEIWRLVSGMGAFCVARPPEFLSDTYGPHDVARETLRAYRPEPDYCCVIYATAPMISHWNVQSGYEKITKDGYDFVISVLNDPDSPLTDAAQFIWCRGTALLQSRSIFSNTFLYPIAKERVCDINNQDDWNRAEKMYEALQCA